MNKENYKQEILDLIYQVEFLQHYSKEAGSI